MCFRVPVPARFGLSLSADASRIVTIPHRLGGFHATNQQTFWKTIRGSAGNIRNSARSTKLVIYVPAVSGLIRHSREDEPWRYRCCEGLTALVAAGGRIAVWV
jgi:hypothetical protein